MKAEFVTKAEYPIAFSRRSGFPHYPTLANRKGNGAPLEHQFVSTLLTRVGGSRMVSTLARPVGSLCV